MNSFEQEIKELEDELLRLKTASEYSLARSATFVPSINVSTGLYNVEFESNGEPILSSFYPATDEWYCHVHGRIPGSSSQVIEVLTTYWDNAQQTYVTDSCPITIIANVPVKSITRIS